MPENESKKIIAQVLLDLFRLEVGEEYTLKLKDVELKYKRTQ
jgi:hypothetical protein